MSHFNGFGFSGYRSFGSGIAEIYPLKKINFIIGQNNVGKSNIINFLNENYTLAVEAIKRKGRDRMPYEKGPTFKLNTLDKHISGRSEPCEIYFPIHKENLEPYFRDLIKAQRSQYTESQIANQVPLFIKLFSNPELMKNDTVWFCYSYNEVNKKFEIKLNEDFNKIYSILNRDEWIAIQRCLFSTYGGDVKESIRKNFFATIQYTPNLSPKIEVIPAIRKIGSSGTTSSDFSGEGIIDRLAKIQNPALTEQEERIKFDSINEFLRNVLENSSATIDIPHDRSMIIVHMDGKTLPLDQLGTGVHEVIILAVASTLLENTIVCIEEPELHLHPTLQRKLIHYLNENTNNQYILTTHSAHLLDAVDAQVFHVTQQDGVSHVESISSDQQKSSICHDLGYKASDILQANCIIWVEGPSDRVYINYWLKAYIEENDLAELIEGVHYSIMFYGGRLFSHLTALDTDEAEEFIEDMISVRRLNRNAVIVFDSDKSSSSKSLNKTKKRLQEEFNRGDGFTWVTKGREVENYLDMEQLENVVKAVHPSASHLVSKTVWSNLLEYQPKKKNGTTTTAKKVNVARKYIEDYKADLNVLDLKSRVKQLVDFITKVNDI